MSGFTVSWKLKKEYGVVAKNYVLGNAKQGTKWNLSNYELLFESDDELRTYQYYHSQPVRENRDVMVVRKDEHSSVGYRGLNPKELDALWSY